MFKNIWKRLTTWETIYSVNPEYLESLERRIIELERLVKE